MNDIFVQEDPVSLSVVESVWIQSRLHGISIDRRH
jgi:hypothetical protein